MIGAAILSTTKFKNKLVASDVLGTLYDDGNAVKLLGTVFSERQRAMMETAFEGQVCGLAEDIYLSDEDAERSVDFGDAIDDTTERMRAICLNIIKNGEFKP